MTSENTGIFIMIHNSKVTVRKYSENNFMVGDLYNLRNYVKEYQHWE